MFNDGLYTCVADVPSVGLVYGELHVEGTNIFNVVEWLNSSGVSSGALPCDLTFSYTYFMSNHSAILTFIGGPDQCNGCSGNAWYLCNQIDIAVMYKDQQDCDAGFFGLIVHDQSFLNCTFVDPCPRNFETGQYQCFYDLNATCQDDGMDEWACNVFDVYIDTTGLGYEVEILSLDDCFYDNEVILYDKYLYFTLDNTTCVGDECDPMFSCPASYTNQNFYFNKTDGDTCRSWGATDTLGNDYRCVWYNSCPRALVNGPYDCYTLNNNTIGHEVVKLDVHDHNMEISFLGSECVINVTFEVFIGHIKVTSIDCGSNSQACSDFGVVIPCDGNLTTFRNFVFVDPVDCGNFIVDNLYNSTVICLIGATAQLVYYSDDCCTEMVASFPFLTNFNYPRYIVNSTDCLAEVQCDFDPNGTACQSMESGLITPYHITNITTGCVNVNSGTTPSQSMCATDCLPSWYAHCHYRFITPAYLNYIPGSIDYPNCETQDEVDSSIVNVIV